LIGHKRAYGTRRTQCQGTDKSQLAGVEFRALTALPSPYAHLETGLRMCPPEKSLDNHCVRCRGVRSPQSGLSGNNREIRALFAYFGAKRMKFLCSPDCVAEREGFEPSVRFCHAKPRHVRKLQIAKPCQRIWYQNPASELAAGPVSVRYSIDPKRRTQGDSMAEGGHVARPRQPVGFASNCLPSGQS